MSPNRQAPPAFGSPKALTAIFFFGFSRVSASKVQLNSPECARSLHNSVVSPTSSSLQQLSINCPQSAFGEHLDWS
ncbi:uncharacterized protein P884DRAFT_256204 [Thermothelomyces heterothallicus CBS 202.75]|uniref:uncharacterized protein n=1 Tax=Thermothelomyces heterothallicus CBS 202.75 TaxID=1149848 RepID=UPI0037431AF8